MSEHLAIDFLRRRYASAIARDDIATACRLRQQLDRMMNDGRRTRAAGAAAPSPDPDLLAPLIEPSGQPALRLAPRLAPAAPVTGLLEVRPVRSPLAGTVPL